MPPAPTESQFDLYRGAIDGADVVVSSRRSSIIERGPSGCAPFALGATFNDLGALFNKSVVQKGLFGPPIFCLGGG